MEVFQQRSEMNRFTMTSTPRVENGRLRGQTRDWLELTSATSVPCVSWDSGVAKPHAVCLPARLPSPGCGSGLAIISGSLLTRERGDGAHLLFQRDTLSVALMAGLVRAPRFVSRGVVGRQKGMKVSPSPPLHDDSWSPPSAWGSLTALTGNRLGSLTKHSGASVLEEEKLLCYILCPALLSSPEKGLRQVYETESRASDELSPALSQLMAAAL